MVKQQVKVVIRTRPTSDFASKNISLDTNNEVSLLNFYLQDRNYINPQRRAWRPRKQQARTMEIQVRQVNA